MNRTRTFFLMVLLTILFVVIGGAVGGGEGALGGDAYIMKPFSSAELVALVKKLLKKTIDEEGE